MLCLLVAVFAALPAHAEDLTVALPDFLNQVMEQQSESVEVVTGANAGSLLLRAKQALAEAAGEPLAVLGRITAVLVLAALAKAFTPESHELSVTPQVDAVVTITVFFLVCQPLLALLGRLEAAVEECRAFVSAFVPCYAALLTGCGQPAAGAVASGLFLSGAVLCADFICRFLVPLLRVFLALNIAAGISDEMDLSGLCGLILQLVRRVLVLCATVYSALICLQSLVAGAGDSLVQKAGKFVMGSAVPVIGRAVSDAMSTVYASMDVIKSTAGVAGICAVAAVFVPVLLECAVYYLTFYFAMVVARLTGSRRCASTFSGFCSCVELYGAILVFFSVIIVVSIALMLKVGR